MRGTLLTRLSGQQQQRLSLLCTGRFQNAIMRLIHVRFTVSLLLGSCHSKLLPKTSMCVLSFCKIWHVMTPNTEFNFRVFNSRAWKKKVTFWIILKSKKLLSWRWLFIHGSDHSFSQHANVLGCPPWSCCRACLFLTDTLAVNKLIVHQCSIPCSAGGPCRDEQPTSLAN